MKKKPNPIGIVGIYKITSPSNKIYIGQSIHLENRERDYKCLFCKSQRKIYHSILKYGWQAHKFEIIEKCEIELLNDLEIYFIVFFDTFNTPHGLNLTTGGNEKHFISEETRQKMSDANKGKIGYWKGKTMSEDHKRKLADGSRGRIKSPETIKKLSESLRNSEKYNATMKSEAHRKKMSEIMKGRPSTRKGIPLSEEHKKKLSESKKGTQTKEKNPMWGKKRPDFAEFARQQGKQRIGEKNNFFGKNHTPETRAKMSEAAKSRTIPPEVRKKMGMTMRGRKRSPEAIEKMKETIRNKKLNKVA